MAYVTHVCGICGKVNLNASLPPDPALVERMAGRLRHRGPDGSGVYSDDHCALGHRRLSIIDLSTGCQPMSNEDRTIQVVFNGEVFNYIELRPELEAKGHRFQTTSDTEVLIHSYEEYGRSCVERFIGDFAFGLWDCRQRRLFCARDRMGVRPFYYTVAGGALLFASEIKALLCDPAVEARISPRSLAEAFIFWAPLPPRTIFDGIFELEPGHLLEVANGEVTTRPYWRLDYPDPRSLPEKPEGEHIEELRAMLEDSVRLRLRADVPVGSYLSGGLDSSAVTALMLHVGHTNMKSFSVAFEDPVYDEREHQQSLSAALETDHHSLVCTADDIARSFPDAVCHFEAPVLRTAGTPLFLLSKLVRDHSIKVVLTGEGADEVLAGYDVFKEAKIRRFWAREPGSKSRPLLLQRLYPYFAMSVGASQAYSEAFFGQGLTDTDDPLYSHMPRFSTTARNLVFLSESLRAQLAGLDPIADYREQVRPIVSHMDALSAAQYIEATTLLPCYILSAQGDRPTMAHSVESRVPYLDHRLVELAARMPPNLRMNGLTEKYALRRAVADLLPEATARRVKQPYMAPDAKCFVGPNAPPYVQEMLSADAIAEAGYFDPRAVTRLHDKCRRADVIGFRDNMAFVGVLSTQLVHDRFVRRRGG